VQSTSRRTHAGVSHSHFDTHTSHELIIYVYIFFMCRTTILTVIFFKYLTVFSTIKNYFFKLVFQQSKTAFSIIRNCNKLLPMLQNFLFRVVLRIYNLHTTSGKYCILRTELLYSLLQNLLYKWETILICLRNRLIFVLLSKSSVIFYMTFFILLLLIYVVLTSLFPTKCCCLDHFDE